MYKLNKINWINISDFTKHFKANKANTSSSNQLYQQQSITSSFSNNIEYNIEIKLKR